MKVFDFIWGRAANSEKKRCLYWALQDWLGGAERAGGRASWAEGVTHATAHGNEEPGTLEGAVVSAWLAGGRAVVVGGKMALTPTVKTPTHPGLNGGLRDFFLVPSLQSVSPSVDILPRDTHHMCINHLEALDGLSFVPASLHPQLVCTWVCNLLSMLKENRSCHTSDL